MHKAQEAGAGREAVVRPVVPLGQSLQTSGRGGGLRRQPGEAAAATHMASATAPRCAA